MLIILLILNYHTTSRIGSLQNTPKINKKSLNIINILIVIILLYCYYILQSKNTSNYNLDVFMKK